jgi:hypothetical protein
MTKDERREKLVEEAAAKLVAGLHGLCKFELEPRIYDDLARAVLALIAERLADVTPEMIEAGSSAFFGAVEDHKTGRDTTRPFVKYWRAMLSASALGNGGKEK